LPSTRIISILVGVATQLHRGRRWPRGAAPCAVAAAGACAPHRWRSCAMPAGPGRALQLGGVVRPAVVMGQRMPAGASAVGCAGFLDQGVAGLGHHVFMVCKWCMVYGVLLRRACLRRQRRTIERISRRGTAHQPSTTPVTTLPAQRMPAGSTTKAARGDCRPPLCAGVQLLSALTALRSTTLR
jgi:hypothetical protein